VSSIASVIKLTTLTAALCGSIAFAAADGLSRADVNAASLPVPAENGPRAVILKAQILLDRARFSPGAIDGRDNDNFLKALAAFQRRSNIDPGPLNQETWAALLATSGAPALIEYEITREDVKGPFVHEIPSDLEAMAALPKLAYRSPRELLAERFHMDQALLAALNPGETFEQAGSRITVANVESKSLPLRVARIEVNKAERTLRAFDEAGKLIAFYPASIGSEENPSPSGQHRVRNAAMLPIYYYRPSLMIAGVTATRSLKIARGPNNPVGAAWIGLDKPSFGIHGTPEPEKVGSAASHGCVRLTNWDALALAHMVRRGTVVDFLDGEIGLTRQPAADDGLSSGGGGAERRPERS
jgi:lipoprotein-anchoring transpeptidase ErfK/SrfK